MATWAKSWQARASSRLASHTPVSCNSVISHMKTSNIIGCLLVTLVSTHAQVAGTTANASQSTVTTPVVPAPTAYRVVDRGANNKVWQRETYELGPKGQVVTHVHKFQELANGMHFKNAQGKWAESKEQIGAFAGGAVAQEGPYQVIFANNLNSGGAIDEQTPDGKRLRSNILGLGYYDRSTDQSVLIAQIQDSQGEMIAANQVLYPNAFSGVNADVRYTYKKGTFEQDVILRTQPPTPESFGLNSETTEIEVITEFLNPPQETIIEHQSPDNGGVDQDVSWGAMRLGRGKAFDLGEQAHLGKQILVRRQYMTVNSRKILLEIVPLKKIEAGLQKLPLQSSTTTKLPAMASTTRLFPKTPLARPGKEPMKLAAATPANQGYVLDYVEMYADTGDICFQGDTTYYISAPFGVYGTMTFEGGTVLKYDVNNSYIWDVGGLDCKTGPYRPAVITSMDDNTVGETISGSSGTPSTGEGSCGFILDGRMVEAGTDILVHDMRFCYLDWGTGWSSPSDGPYYVDFWNCQFINCAHGHDMSWGTHLGLHNVLYSGATTTALNSSSGADDFVVTAEQVTADVASFGVTPDPSWMTNSIVLESSGPTETIIGNSVITTSPTLPLFQTAGAGSYYLATNSPYRGTGTPNISPAMLSELGQKTTWPPIVYYIPGVFFSTSLNLFPQASRDTNSSPDLGYHYDSLDYVFGSTFITNATITVNAGTAIGIFSTNFYNYGLTIANNAQLLSHGAPNKLNRIVEYNTVQEERPAGWKKPSYGMVTHFIGTNFLIDCSFTDWSSMAQDACHVQNGSMNAPLAFQNCQFHGGSILSYFSAISLTNCLLESVNVDLEPWDDSISAFRNNDFWYGTFSFWPALTNSIIKDNLFDHTIIPDGLAGDGVTYIGGHNAYVTNCDQIDPTYSGDIVLGNSPAYQTSWLGNYYLPTNCPLINAGSTTADQVGLYHFTTQTNQVKEANSTVDIGYHYVAMDAYGNPIDTDGDGIPDYLEDTNGDGVFGEGDFGDWLVSFYNGLSRTHGLQVFTPLK